MRKAQAGFTLIELISVIVILGILSAFALPRFANLEVQARAASVQGLGGAVRSASALVHAVWLANGSTGTVTLEGGQPITVNAAGYPSNRTQLIRALQEDPLAGGANSPYVAVGATGMAARGSSSGATCSVTYDATTATLPPVITLDVSDCS